MKRITRDRSMLFQALGLFATALFLTCSMGHAATEVGGFDLMPYASIAEIYDDNVNFSNTNEIDDLITSASVGLLAKHESRLTVFQLSGTLRHELFADNDDFNNTSGDVMADWSQELSPYDRIRLRDNYTHTDEPRTFADAFNNESGRFTYQTNQFMADYTHDFNSQWSGTGRYANEFTEFDAVNRSDTMMNAAGAELTYHHSSQTHLSGAYDFKHRDFDETAFASDSDATSHILSAGLRYYLTKQLYFDGRLGVSMIDAYNGDSMTEPLVMAKLTDDIDETTTWDVQFKKEHSLNAYIQDIFDEWEVSTSIKKRLTRRLGASVSAFYGDGEYVVLNRDEQLVGATLSAVYDLTKDLQGTVRYSHTNVDSSSAVQEYQKNVVLVGLVWNF